MIAKFGFDHTGIVHKYGFITQQGSIYYDTMQYLQYNLTGKNSTRTFESGNTRNEPPPAASVMTATYFGLTSQYRESQELFVILMLS